MCAIVGISGNWEPEIVKGIMEWSRIRGLHAFGFSYAAAGHILTEKFHDYDLFLQRLLSIKPKKFIAHFRYSTSGDWKELENNQPITSNEMSLVFNGVIDMGTKNEIEKNWNCQLKTDNDGEVALIKMKDGLIDDLLIKRSVSFAGIFLSAEKMMAIRNKKRPMHVAVKNDCVYLASTRDILNRSGLLETTLLKEYEQHNY